MKIVGIDGCPGGWIAVCWDTGADTWNPSFHGTFNDILTSHPDATCIGIDIPIGLRDDGHPRGCDVAARQLLGWPRGTSVFPAPQRRLLNCDSYGEASERSYADFGKRISRQAFGIYRKVREVDHQITPERQQRVIEVHPEVSFWAMAGNQPMTLSKKTASGFEERRGLLERCLPLDIPATREAAKRSAPFAGRDDLLDALAAAWTTRRYAVHAAKRLPADEEYDERGLRMEIVY